MSFGKFLIGYLLAAAFYNLAATWIIYPLIAFLCAITGMAAMTGLFQIIAIIAFLFYTVEFIAKSIDIFIAVVHRMFTGPVGA